MQQEKINYDEIMSLGFAEEITEDSSYYTEHGFNYAIITKNLTKKIYLYWTKETKLCEMVRIDSPKTCNIKSRMPIINLKHLKDLINFYSDKEEQNFDYSTVA
ncbi:MAG: hypothetical protein QQN55_00980 [Nitrosopumilus sp.]